MKAWIGICLLAAFASSASEQCWKDDDLQKAAAFGSIITLQECVSTGYVFINDIKIACFVIADESDL